jgi:hypothetical protein
LSGITGATLNVQFAEADLKSGRAANGQPIPITSALPGDIAVQNDTSHIGICMTQYCTTVYSNSSSNQNFTGNTGPNMYGSGPPRIYRLVK